MTTSDSITKSELIEQFENIKDKNGFELRVFPEGSNDDQVLYEDGGCTFAYKGKTYGSCDGVLFKKNIIVGNTALISKQSKVLLCPFFKIAVGTFLQKLPLAFIQIFHQRQFCHYAMCNDFSFSCSNV